MLLLLLACNPWSDLADREALWWGPTDRLEAEAGVALIELPAGEPVGYWPRVVIGQDWIEVDNRAWLLALPPAVFEETAQEELLALLMERQQAVPIRQGLIPADERRGQLVSGLYDVLLEMAEAHKAFSRGRSDELGLDGRLLIVPTPGTSTATFRQVLFTAGQAQYGRAGVAGSVGGRLRMAAAFAPGACAMRVTLTEAGERVRLSNGSNACTIPPTAVESWGRELAEACLGRLDVVAAEVFAAHPDVAPPDTGDWRCLGVETFLVDGRLDVLLPALAALHPLYPDVRQGYLMGGIEQWNTRPCDPSPPLRSMTEEELDEVCGTSSARTTLDWSMQGTGEGRTLEHLLLGGAEEADIGDVFGEEPPSPSAP